MFLFVFLVFFTVIRYFNSSFWGIFFFSFGLFIPVLGILEGFACLLIWIFGWR